MSLITKKLPILILVCGGSGSGKTTIANYLIKNLSNKHKTVVIRQDNFYKSTDSIEFQKKILLNYDHPDAFDWKLMRASIKNIMKQKTTKIPIYDYGKHVRSDKFIAIDPHDIIIFEGIYTFYDSEINKLANLKIFIDTPADERLIRRMMRDINERNRSVELVIEQWRNTVRPMYVNFVENQKKEADLIIPWYKLNSLAIKAIRHAISGLIK